MRRGMVRDPYESYSFRCWMPTYTEPVVPFGTPLKALAVGIPFAEQVTAIRLEPGRIVFEYGDDQ